MRSTAPSNPASSSSFVQSIDLPPPSASSKLWGVEWARRLPTVLGDSGVTAEISDFETVALFFKRNLKEIYQLQGSDSPFLSNEGGESKQRYYHLLSDCFSFKMNGQIIGIVTAAPSDWSTYYLRNGSVLPSHQNRGLIQEFLHFLFDILGHHGVQRIETEVSPSNLRQIHLLNKLAFNVSGLHVSERWGTVLRLTKYLDRMHERFFLDQFCAGLKPQLEPSRSQSKPMERRERT